MGTSPSRFWRRLWGIIIGIILFAIILLTLWFQSDNDLQRIDERARSLGILTTWESLKPPSTPDELRQRWQRCLILGKQLSYYQGSTDDKSQSPPLRRFSPIPESYRQHLSREPPDVVEELFVLLDKLDASPFICIPSTTGSEYIADISRSKHLVAWLCQYIQATHDPARTAFHLLTICQASAHPSFACHLVNLTNLSISSGAIAQRIPDLTPQREQIARRIDAAASTLDLQFLESRRAEFILLRHLVDTRSPAHAAAQQQAAIWYRDCAFADISSIPLHSGRDKALGLQLDFLTAINPLPDRCHELLRAWEDRNPEPFTLWRPWEFENILTNHSTIAHGYTIKLHYQTKLRLALVAAELRQTPWPVDTFDPAGKPLRRFERNGKLIGAYSVGTNGIDDGGDEKADITFPLYGPWKLPVPGTSPTP